MLHLHDVVHIMYGMTRYYFYPLVVVPVPVPVAAVVVVDKSKIRSLLAVVDVAVVDAAVAAVEHRRLHHFAHNYCYYTHLNRTIAQTMIVDVDHWMNSNNDLIDTVNYDEKADHHRHYS